jgi:V/A-type H+-transporting ATPase subunit E
MVEEILREAGEQAAGIVAAAKKEAATILNAARFTAKEEEEHQLKEAQEKGRRVYEEVLIDGKMKAKKEALQKREEIINEVFKEVERKLQRYASSKKYQEDLIRLAIGSCKKLGSDQVVIFANKRDLRVLKSARKKITSALSTKGTKVNVLFGEPIQTTGGVRVSTADRKIEIDDTFEGRMRRDFDTLRMKIAKLLFEGSR